MLLMPIKTLKATKLGPPGISGISFEEAGVVDQHGILIGTAQEENSSIMK